MKFPKCSILSTLVAFPLSLSAQWIGPDEGNYLDPGNWSGGAINDTFTGTLAPPGGDYGVILNGNRATTGPFTLNYSNDVNYMLRGDGGPTDTLTLNGNLYVNGGSITQNKDINFGNDNNINFDLGGATRLISVTPGFRNTDGDILRLKGNVLNGGIIKTGSGRLQFENGPAGFTGPLIIRSGRVELNTSLATTSIQVGYFGRIRIDQSNKLNDGATVTLSGGSLELNNDTSSETIGDLALSHGTNFISFRNSSPTGTLTIGNFSRSSNSTLLIGNNQENNNNGSRLGNTYRVQVTNAASVTSSLMGGGGAAGTKTVSILPWSSYTVKEDNNGRAPEVNDNLTNNPHGGFLTFDGTDGFRALNRTSEYESGGTLNNQSSWGATENVRISGNNSIAGGGNGSNTIILDSSRTVNSLFFDRTGDTSSGDQKINLNGNVLTVASGGILVGSGTNPEFTNGTLAFGATDAYIHSRNDININATLSGSGNLVVASGNVGINANNSASFTGNFVAQGELIVSHPQAISPANSIILAGASMVSSRPDDSRTGIFRIQATVNAKNLSGTGRINFNSGDVDLKLGSVATNLNTNPIYSGRNIVAAGNGSIVTVGDDSGPYEVGILNLGKGNGGGQQDGTLLFESGSTLNLDFAGDELFDQITFMRGSPVQGSWDAEFLTGSTIAIDFLGGYSPANGTTWQVFSLVTDSDSTGFGTFVEGTPIYGNTDMTFSGPGGYSFALSNTGLLSVTIIPEPSAALLLGIGALLAQLQRRRRP